MIVAKRIVSTILVFASMFVLACGGNEVGAGSNSLKVESLAQNVVGTGEMEVRLSISRDGVSVDDAVIVVSADMDSREAEHLGDGVYRAVFVAWEISVEVDIRVGEEDYAQYLLIGPSPHRIFDTRCESTSAGKTCSMRWEVENGIRAAAPSIHFGACVVEPPIDDGYYVFSCLAEEIAESSIIELRREESLRPKGGSGGSLAIARYTDSVDLTFAP